MNKSTRKGSRRFREHSLDLLFSYGPVLPGWQTETWQGLALQKAVAMVDAVLHACEIIKILSCYEVDAVLRGI